MIETGFPHGGKARLLLETRLFGDLLFPLGPEHSDEMKIEKGRREELRCLGLPCLQSPALGKALDLSELSAERRQGENPARPLLLALLPAQIEADVIRGRAGEGSAEGCRDPTLSPAGMSA